MSSDHEPFLQDNEAPSSSSSSSSSSSPFSLLTDRLDVDVSSPPHERSTRALHRLRLAAADMMVHKGRFLSISCFLLFAIMVLIGLFYVYDHSNVTPAIPFSPNDGISDAREKSWEEKLRGGLTLHTALSEQFQYDLLVLSNQTHLAGSPADWETAQYFKRAFLEADLPLVEIEQHSVLLTFPLKRSLTVVSPPSARFSATLTERPYDEDPTSSRIDVPTYLGYSASGQVLEAGLVYARYCLRDDFEYLLRQKVKITGCVCLCRYGSGWRGDKVSLSAEFGCAATLIYSDPQDDGYVRGEVYPNGPWKPEFGVQRGSIMNGNGDALTPNWPSAASPDDGYRISMDEARGPSSRVNNDCPLPRIPALPISWHDALPLLGNMTGLKAPESWQGGLTSKGVTYTLGGNRDVLVNMEVQLEEKTKPIWNVIATIPGSVDPAAQVLMGAHRDAWTTGAIDPTSGGLVLLATARALGVLYSQGWRPSRTIKLISWDGEEQGLIGSVEYSDEHEHTLLHHAVAYLNFDTAVTSFDFLDLVGTPSLSAVISDVAKSVVAPNVNQSNPDGTKSLYDDWLKSHPVIDPNYPYAVLADAGGTGSDYGSFVQRLGVASLDAGYAGSRDYQGVYHTSYDSYTWQMLFGDGKFAYAHHAALSSFAGSLVMRLSDAQLLPFVIGPYTAVIQRMLNPLIPIGISTFPSLERQLHQLNNSLAVFHEEAVVFDSFVASMRSALSTAQMPSQSMLNLVNHLLSHLERYFLYMPGLPNRAWYRNLVWCTSITDGYSGAGLALIGDGLALHQQEETARSLWILQHSFMSITRELNETRRYLHLLQK